ncbi:MAG: LysM peptidoglycan-binding domain-containing protein [Bacteroidetes bacterium]|nr:LysM peptidoglycan-binding domain-containing protein [Bacteroidota bacterium]
MRFLNILVFTLFSFSIFAQSKITNEEYIEKYYPIAVRKMVEYKIPASITLAQGILESGSGNSALAKNANNHFGIKCHKDWEGKGYYMDDDEANECFRVYTNPEESFADHSMFLTSRARYKFLFEEYAVDDYKNWAKGLKAAGYATNPKYPELLTNLIERYNLNQYDKMGLNDILASSTSTTNNEVNDMQEWEETATATLKTIEHNGVKAIVSNGIKLSDIAKKYDLTTEHLMQYNDVKKDEFIDNGVFIYLAAKKNKGDGIKHYVKRGETMWEISQQHGIKLKSLYKRNKIKEPQEVLDGEILYLQGKRETAPKTVSHKFVMNEKQKIKDEIEAAKQAKLEAERKAKEEAERKAKEEAERKAKEEAAKQALIEMQEREAAAQRELEAKQKAYEEALLKEQMEQEKQNTETNEQTEEVIENKAADEDVQIEKPYQETTAKTYTVKAGDTLYGISNKYYVTVEKLIELNGLENSNLKIGQILIVSP